MVTGYNYDATAIRRPFDGHSTAYQGPLRSLCRNQLATVTLTCLFILPAPLGSGALSDDARLTSDVCLSVAYIEPKSRTERPMKTKIGTEVGHVTRQGYTTFRSKVNLQGAGAYCGGLPHSLFRLQCRNSGVT